MDTVWGMMLLSWAPWLLLGAGGLYVGLRHARALERRNSSNADIRELQERVAQLEDSLAAAVRDISRIDDSQQFTSELIGGRASAQNPPGAPRLP
jgi:hypothetical protein